MADTGRTICIIGGAGYIGAMLCDQFSKRTDVAKIVAIDKEEKPELLEGNEKIIWITANTAEPEAWLAEVTKHAPDTIVHTAWQIRAMYGDAPTQWKWNVDGSQNVFAAAFDLPSVRKLVYFSTASSYSARQENELRHLFTEAEGFRDDDYIYAKEKKVTEDNLAALYEERKTEEGSPQIFIVRPAAITGPRGRYMRMRFGLQSALSGQLKGNFFYRVVSLMTAFVPITEKWVRQYIHEDDVHDIVEKFVFEDLEGSYEVFNITPPGEPVYGPQMAEAVGKKAIKIYPWMVRFAFWFFWHVTRGRIPTCPGSWRFYSYPIVMDGRKLTQQYGYQYKYESRNAFQYTNGRYESMIPEANRNTL